MGTTTKRDLAQEVARSTGVNHGLAQSVVDALFTAMLEQLMEGSRIEVRGFGALATRKVKPRLAARNPRTGEIIYVPARRRVHFRPGKDLKAGLHGAPD